MGMGMGIEMEIRTEFRELAINNVRKIKEKEAIRCVGYYFLNP